MSSDATTSRYRLWGRPTSVNVQKVLVALEACGIDDFEMVHASAWMAPGKSTYSAVDAEVAAVNTAAYKAMNPNPTVPTLELPAGGGALWESNVIVRFLAREHAPALIGGSSLELAAQEKWMDWQACRGGSSRSVKTLCDHAARLPPAERDAAVFADAATRFAKALAVVERSLADGPFLGGGAFSVADIPLGCVINRWKLCCERARALFGDALDLSALPLTPNVDRWYRHLLREPAFQKGAVIPEKGHLSIPVGEEELPPWLRGYNERYGVGQPSD